MKWLCVTHRNNESKNILMSTTEPNGCCYSNTPSHYYKQKTETSACDLK